jgi:hypothetical protein
MAQVNRRRAGSNPAEAGRNTSLNASRVWRVRRRGDAIDASLRQIRAVWQLQLTRKGKVIGEWEFDTRGEAITAATLRRQAFERAGWTHHW